MLTVFHSKIYRSVDPCNQRNTFSCMLKMYCTGRKILQVCRSCSEIHVKKIQNDFVRRMFLHTVRSKLVFFQAKATMTTHFFIIVMKNLSPK